MNLQFVSDEKGNITAVQIPIGEWQEIERKMKLVEQDEWQEVSEDEIAAIEAGLQDIAEGRTVSHADVLRRSRELRDRSM